MTLSEKAKRSIGSEGAEVFSAVDGELEAREPDLGAGPPPLVICVVEPGLNILGLAIPNCHSPFSRPGWGARGGGGCAASVRDVCGPESDMPCPPCVVS